MAKPLDALEYAQVLADFFREQGFVVTYENGSTSPDGHPTLTRLFIARKKGRPGKGPATLWVFPDRLEFKYSTPLAEELAELLDGHLSNGFETQGFRLVKTRGSGAPAFKRGAPSPAKPVERSSARGNVDEAAAVMQRAGWRTYDPVFSKAWNEWAVNAAQMRGGDAVSLWFALDDARIKVDGPNPLINRKAERVLKRAGYELRT